jgi:hypothetical protein
MFEASPCTVVIKFMWIEEWQVIKEMVAIVCGTGIAITMLVIWYKLYTKKEKP